MRDAAQRCLAIGTFDGVHLGHRAILKGADAVLTFRPHPLEVLAPARAPRLLQSHGERIAALRAAGVASVTVLDFTPEFARTEPDGFLTILRRVAEGRNDASAPRGRGVSPRQNEGKTPFRVRCGENWRFGKDGAGDVAFLRARGIDVEVVPSVELAGERISSSRIRKALGDGDVPLANAMLGRRFSVTSPVVSGKGLGAELGFPTLNLTPGRPLPLRIGVYAVEVGGCRGVANYGLAPTLGDRAWPEPVLEVHLLGPVPNKLGQTVDVDFIAFVREERRFESLIELKRQIAADCDFATHL